MSHNASTALPRRWMRLIKIVSPEGDSLARKNAWFARLMPRLLAVGIGRATFLLGIGGLQGYVGGRGLFGLQGRRWFGQLWSVGGERGVRGLTLQKLGEAYLLLRPTMEPTLPVPYLRYGSLRVHCCFWSVFSGVHEPSLLVLLLSLSRHSLWSS